MNNIKRIKKASDLAALRAEFWSLPVDAYVDRETVAATLFVAVVSMEAYATKGGGPKYTRIGRRALYRKGDVLDWAGENGRKVENTSQLSVGGAKVTTPMQELSSRSIPATGEFGDRSTEVFPKMMVPNRSFARRTQ